MYTSTLSFVNHRTHCSPPPTPQRVVPIVAWSTRPWTGLRPTSHPSCLPRHCSCIKQRQWIRPTLLHSKCLNTSAMPCLLFICSDSSTTAVYCSTSNTIDVTASPPHAMLLHPTYSCSIRLHSPMQLHITTIVHHHHHHHHHLPLPVIATMRVEVRSTQVLMTYVVHGTHTKVVLTHHVRKNTCASCVIQRHTTSPTAHEAARLALALLPRLHQLLPLPLLLSQHRSDSLGWGRIFKLYLYE